MADNLQSNSPALRVHPSRRLVSLSVLKAVAGCDEDRALAMIERGEIEWAFDIASGRKLREVRVLKESLPGSAVKFGGLPEVINHIIPPTRTKIRSSELCAWFDCSQDTVGRLVRAGDLRGAVHGHTLEIEADTVRGFLKTRRIA